MHFLPIGFVRSPYQRTSEIPKGFGAKHDAEGVLEVHAEFEAGLADIEGFSHLYVIWVFDQSEGFELLGTPPIDDRPHGVFATRSPETPQSDWLVGRRAAAARWAPPARPRRRHARWHAHPRHQAVSVERPGRRARGAAGWSDAERRKSKEV